MRQSTLNRMFGSIFVLGLSFVVILSLYSTFPSSAVETVSQTILGTKAHAKHSCSSKTYKESTTASQKYPLTFIPSIGLGTWLSKPKEVTGAVTAALDIGYRHIDTAKAYRNEKEVGKGIELSGIPRNEIWVTSKLFNDDHHPDDVESALRKTLSDLGLEYLDLYLMHWPVAITDGKFDPSISYISTWHAMEKLVDLGLTKNIGISNFAQHQVEDILNNSTIRPAAHEFETHPFLQQSDFVSWNIRQGIQVIAYSPFGNLNPIYHSDLPSILDDEFWINLAESKNATVPQTVLAWGLQRGTIVIPKSVHANRIEENWGSKGIRFSEEELAAVAETDKKVRFNNPGKSWGVKLFDDLDGSSVEEEEQQQDERADL